MAHGVANGLTDGSDGHVVDQADGGNDAARAEGEGDVAVVARVGRTHGDGQPVVGVVGQACLLYTSDAADERSRVDLGGRRIIKKKKTKVQRVGGLSCIRVIRQ